MAERKQCAFCMGWYLERHSRFEMFCSRRCRDAFGRWQDEEYARLTG